MREHHRVHEPNPLREPCRYGIGERGEDVGPEEKYACGGERQIESLEQPQSHERLNRKAAGKGVQAEQRGKLIDNSSRWTQRRRARVRILRLDVRQTPVKSGANEPQRSV